MSFEAQIENLDPKLVLVPADRQRTAIDISELESSVLEKGFIHPIVVRRSEDNQTIILVAGGQRLTVAKKHNLIIPVRFLETLDELEAAEIEFEENNKRADLPWRDHVNACGNIHNMYRQRNGEKWPATETAKKLSINPGYFRQILAVHKDINNIRLAAAGNITQAIGIIERFSQRQTESIVGEIAAATSDMFAKVASGEANVDITKAPEALTIDQAMSNITNSIDLFDTSPNTATPATSEPKPSSNVTAITNNPILVANFIDWSSTYTGEKFNFIHVDFPYGVNTRDSLTETYENNPKLYWQLFEALTSNLDKIMSYSAHMMFWFSYVHHDETKVKLRAANLHVIDMPLIWFKSDGRGAAPGLKGTQPRHVYEGAFLCARGQRPLVKQIGNGYACPNVTNPIHPTQKPEPMLRYFFEGLIDETTTMLDPTAGSGSAIKVAEALGVKRALGLELDESYAAAANGTIIRARTQRISGR